MTAAPLVLYNEIRKELIITWNYRANTAIELLTLVFVFVFISYFAGGGEIDSERLPGSLLGFLVWYYAAFAISSMSGGITGEASIGTLEQLYMSPVPTWLVFCWTGYRHVRQGDSDGRPAWRHLGDDPACHPSSGTGGSTAVRPNDGWPVRFRIRHWRLDFGVLSRSARLAAY